MSYAGDGRMPHSKWPKEKVARFTLGREAWRALSRTKRQDETTRSRGSVKVSIA
jgi:hypothetical protein